jgi:hypothetical protein
MTASPRLQQWLEGLDTDGVLRAQGADAARVRARSPRLVAVAERALKEGAALLEPRLTYRLLQVRRREPGGLVLEGGGSLTGPLAAQTLSGSSSVVVVAATIGGRLEARVSRTFGLDLPYALALDGLGSHAVQTLSLSARNLARELAGRERLRATAPVSPGMAGWPLEAGQQEIFRLLDPVLSGVRLTAGGWMLPRKSLSMVFGLGTEAGGRGEICDACTSRDSCRHRKRDGTPA